MKKIIFIYRNNTLFDKYVPKIISYLCTLNIEVETKIHKAGNELSLIEINNLQKFVDTNKDTCLYVFDRTCATILDNDEINSINLDNLFLSSIKTKKYWKQGYKICFQQLLKQTLTEKIQSIIIVRDHIADHVHEDYLVRSIESLFKKHGFPKIKWQTFFNDDHWYKNQIKSNLVKEYEKERQKVMQDFLSKSIIEKYGSLQIIFVEKYENINDEMKNEEKYLIIIDRHCEIMTDCRNILTWTHKAQLFVLPFINTIEHLITAGKSKEQFDIKEICNKIISKVK